MHKSWDFKVAEGPVKQLVISFLEGAGEFNEQYSNYVKVSRSGIPVQFLEKASLMRIPPAAEAVMQDRNGIEWILKLSLVPSNHEWNDDLFKNFEHQEPIKNTIGQMIKSAQLIFQILKKKHEIMKTLSMKTDTDNLTMFLTDSELNYSHSVRLFALMSKSSVSKADESALDVEPSAADSSSEESDES